MAFVAADWSIASNGDIRYIGDAHGGASPSYAAVLEFHRAIQDFADNSGISADDIVYIVSETPTNRQTDNIIELLNSYNIDQTAAEHLYDGSIIQNGGDDIWDGIQNFGNATFIDIIQNGTVVANDFWNSFTPAGFNADAASGISHSFLIQVRSAGADIDGRRLIGISREFGNTYAEFPIGGGTNRGNNTLALSEQDDIFNNTAAGTVAGWTDITNTEGYRQIDVTGDTVGEPYYSEWDLGSRTKSQFYERLKWLTRRGTAETLYGLAGDLFRGITHDIPIDNPTGTFQEPEQVSWSGGTGQLFAIDSTTSGTRMWIQLLTGTAPSDNDTITGGASAATADVNGSPTSRNISTPFVGASTGTNIIGSYGLGIESADLVNGDQVFDLDNTQRLPPNNVTFTVNGLVSGEDRVLVGPEDGAGGLDVAQLTLNGALTGGEATITVNGAIPSDTPSSGTIRVFDGTSYVRVTYTGFSGSDFTGCSGTPAASNGANVFISYIDELASGTFASFTAVYSSDRTLFVRVRDGGGTPIKTFETTGTLGSAGGSSTAIRTSDA